MLSWTSVHWLTTLHNLPSNSCPSLISSPPSHQIWWMLQPQTSFSEDRPKILMASTSDYMSRFYSIICFHYMIQTYPNYLSAPWRQKRLIESQPHYGNLPWVSGICFVGIHPHLPGNICDKCEAPTAAAAGPSCSEAWPLRIYSRDIAETWTCADVIS